MSTAVVARPTISSAAALDALCRLTLSPAHPLPAVTYVAGLTADGRAELLSLADSHHVILRALGVVAARAPETGAAEAAQWAEQAMRAERTRIQIALAYLRSICDELESAGCPTTVMKTLDHWPDLGNDLDLYTTAADDRVVKVMQEKFSAVVEPRSWGDRLAHKWNFAVPGLRESVEVHVRRLGQTGEHTAMARRFVTRRREVELEGHRFFVPAPEERVVVATLQRMYRHFYFRVCDIANTAALVESAELDYTELRRSADLGGIWPGVATYLVIVSDYVRRYRGQGLPLPEEVTRAARFGGEKVAPRGRFLRVPLMPHGADLYTRQVTTTAFRGDVPATFRLTLLPPLASAAAIAYRITGSDKGIW